MSAPIQTTRSMDLRIQSPLQVSKQTSTSQLLEFGYVDGPEWQPPGVLIPLRCLAISPGYREIWHAGEPVLSETLNNQASWHQSERIAAFVTQMPAAKANHRAIYLQAHETAQQKGFGHLLRTWNFLDDIHDQSTGLERYQGFCVERHAALEQLHALNLPSPAATAIGAHLGQDCFVFLFATEPGQVIENKRQVSAWEYPSQYAPKGPRFSRAMWVDGLLMCSGTASVVGHATQHENDLQAQFKECINNVQVLVDASPLSVRLEEGVYRFYLRDKADLPALTRLIQTHGIHNHIILEGDICRRNLMLECEVVFQ